LSILDVDRRRWSIGSFIPKRRKFLIRSVFVRSVLQLLVTANPLHSSLILSTLMMEAIGSSETSDLTTAIWRLIPEDGNLHSHRRENLKSYIALTGWAL
jgi:hypothetical protein